MSNDKIIGLVAETLSLPAHSVKAAADLLARGDTVPFISRYRKEATGNLNEIEIRAIEQEIGRLQQLDERRESILSSIGDQGKLTDELRARIADAKTMAALEDIYLPFRPKRRTRATVARERGLEPLAKILMSGRTAEKAFIVAKKFVTDEVPTADEALAGASDIIAEWLNESSRARNTLRNRMRREAVITSSFAKGKETDSEAAKYNVYKNFSHPLRSIPSHNYLALRRGESEGFLKVNIKFNDDAAIDDIAKWFIPSHASEDVRNIIHSALTDGYKRLMRPSIETELGAEWKEKADRTAIGLFADNLRQLLLASPLRDHRVLAIDPGFRTGCKVVALDENGTLLDDEVIFPNEPRRDTVEATRILMRLIDRYNIDAIALGDRTASRETEAFLRSSGISDFVDVYIVSENGASVYSASDLARQEFPDKDVTVRGAVSIGRRLIDPLAELVKIDPKSIGVGQYQHDVDQNALRDSLDFTVMSCVNLVGVDLNTASPRLLSYISGIGPSMASKIVEYRTVNGAFGSRSDLMKVPRLGSKIFEQAAGFLRIPSSKNPLDNTGIHPESYHIVEKMARDLGLSTSELPANQEAIDRIDKTDYAEFGDETISDILEELRKPGRDPRLEAENVEFSSDIHTIDDIHADMILPGKVTNITAFGAFVDLGIKENGLLHVSQMASKRVSNPGQIVRIGQILNVKVIEVDYDRRRISLSIKDMVQ